MNPSGYVRIADDKRIPFLVFVQPGVVAIPSAVALAAVGACPGDGPVVGPKVLSLKSF